jgi:hypothetical protein
LVWSRAGAGAFAYRFYAAGPNSHSSMNRGEADGLRALERRMRPRPRGSVPGLAARPSFASLTPTGCASSLVPLYRMYNGRAAMNDSNHRSQWTRPSARDAAQGWSDEGVAMRVQVGDSRPLIVVLRLQCRAHPPEVLHDAHVASPDRAVK